MPNKLSLPPELQHLLENRDVSDRRLNERRAIGGVELKLYDADADEEARRQLTISDELEADRRDGQDRRQSARRGDEK